MSVQSRKSAGIPDVDIDEIEVEVDKVAQGGFSVLYKGSLYIYLSLSR